MSNKLELLNLKPEEITQERLKEILNTLFYQIRNLRAYSPEKQDDLYDCLDSGIGVMCLMSDLMGTAYDLVTFEDGHRDYVKKQPADPLDIYKKTNFLIDKVNSLVDPNYESVFSNDNPVNN
ncbi:MAG: hypothetical protein E7356_02350 [Clostridiales bacterium]|nr:hypothetical protein [Clostridiales bacterium]